LPRPLGSSLLSEWSSSKLRRASRLDIVQVGLPEMAVELTSERVLRRATSPKADSIEAPKSFISDD
jgi:hypothetical protein